VVRESNSIVPPGLILIPDDSNGRLLALGRVGDIERFQQLLPLLDVRRALVSLKLSFSSPVDKVAYDVTANLRNNTPWNVADKELGLDLVLTPRRNDDGTVTLFVTSRSASDVRFTARLVKGEPIEFVASRTNNGTFKIGPKSAQSIKEKDQVTTVFELSD
jgi:hypothetical protein